jgi:hypothetical protein
VGEAPTNAGFVGIGESGAVSGLTRTTYEKVLTAKTLGVRLTRNQSQWSFSFNLQGTPQAMKPVVAACPISSALESEPTAFDQSHPAQSGADQLGKAP